MVSAVSVRETPATVQKSSNASAGTPGTFATRHTATIDDIYFDVVGVGAVPLPLSHRTAQKADADPAKLFVSPGSRAPNVRAAS